MNMVVLSLSFISSIFLVRNVGHLNMAVHVAPAGILFLAEVTVPGMADVIPDTVGVNAT